MHSFKNQFLRKMRALIFFYINNAFNDITTKYKIIATCKKKFAKLRQIFSTRIEKKRTIKSHRINC